MGFPMVPKLMTLHDLERGNACHFASFHRILQLREPITSKYSWS